MKVKIFTNYDEDNLCESINSWTSENSISVIDLKYSNISDGDGQCFYTILVMYK